MEWSYLTEPRYVCNHDSCDLVLKMIFIVIVTRLQFYNGPSPPPFVNSAVNTIRDPHQEFCDQLYQSFRSSFVDSEQIVMGSASKGFLHNLEHILKSNCEMPNLPSGFDGEDVSDCRPALLKFMATATPDSRVASDILNHFSHHKDAMTVTPANYFTSPITGEHSVEFTVDNVPDTVNPVKAKLAYIQVPSHGGKSTDLHLVWRVRGFSIYLYHSHFIIVIRSLKWRCKTTGMRLQSPLLRLTRSSLSLTGPLMHLFPYRMSLKALPPIMSSDGASTIQLVAIGQLTRRTMML